MQIYGVNSQKDWIEGSMESVEHSATQVFIAMLTHMDAG